MYKIFGSPRIVVGGCFQSGPYIDELFRKMIACVPKEHAAKNILLLGLGGGGAVREIRTRFPNAHITAIEYDPVMVSIAKNIYLKPSDWNNVEVITDDVRNVIPTLNKKFEFIIVDLFIGRSLSPLLETDDFVKQLIPCLAYDGYMAMNFFRQKKSVAPVFDRFFSRWKNLSFNTNEMALYRNFGHGCAGDPLPEGYKDKKESPTYIARNTSASSSKWFSKRAFVGDSEPLLPCKGEAGWGPVLTWVWWQPLTIMRKRGWMHFPFFIIDHYQKGIGVVTEQNKDSYWEDWSHHAKRHRDKWLKDTRYEIVDVPFASFEQAYHATRKLNWFQRKECMWTLKSHIDDYPKDVRLFGVREKETRTIVAGLAVIQYKDIRLSLHTTSFFHDDVKQTSVGFGLIDHWYAEGIKEDIRFFNFGNVWKKGDPRAWKGYSQFKRQFHLYLLRYPTPLVKLFWSRK